MADQPEPKDPEPKEPEQQQAADGRAGLGVLLVIAAAVWAVSTWKEKGIAGFTALVTSFWDTVVIGSLTAMSDPYFWLNSWLGWILICVIWAVVLVGLGKFARGFHGVIHACWQAVVPKALASMATTCTFVGIALLLGVMIHSWIWPEPAPVDPDVSRREQLLEEAMKGDFYRDVKVTQERLQELSRQSEFLQPDPVERERLVEELDKAKAYALNVEQHYRLGWQKHMENMMDQVRARCAMHGEEELEPLRGDFTPATLIIPTVMLVLVTLSILGAGSKS